MAQRYRGRNAEKLSLLKEVGEESTESGAVEKCRLWPVFLMGQKA